MLYLLKQLSTCPYHYTTVMKATSIPIHVVKRHKPLDHHFLYSVANQQKPKDGNVFFTFDLTSRRFTVELSPADARLIGQRLIEQANTAEFQILDPIPSRQYV
jgi:hypothetical protein